MSIKKACIHVEKDVLLSCVYFPPEGSRYAYDDCFTELDNELEILNESDNYYVMLVGNFNARTGHKEDVLGETLIPEMDDEMNVHYEIEVEEGLELLGLPVQRISCDDKTNNFGNRLIEFCQINMLYIYLMVELDETRMGVCQPLEATVLLIMLLVHYHC